MTFCFIIVTISRVFRAVQNSFAANRCQLIRGKLCRRLAGLALFCCQIDLLQSTNISRLPVFTSWVTWEEQLDSNVTVQYQCLLDLLCCILYGSQWNVRLLEDGSTSSTLHVQSFTSKGCGSRGHRLHKNHAFDVAWRGVQGVQRRTSLGTCVILPKVKPPGVFAMSRFIVVCYKICIYLYLYIYIYIYIYIFIYIYRYKWTFIH